MRSILLSVTALGLAAAAGLPLTHRHHGTASASTHIAADTLTAAISADTLTSGVSEWNKENVTATSEGASRQVLKGSTHDLSVLDVRAITLNPGSAAPLPNDGNFDRLLVVKEGSLTINSFSFPTSVGPGGVVLFSAIDSPSITNKSAMPATFYLFRFQPRLVEDSDRDRRADATWTTDWPQMTVQKTPKGESRQILNRPASWLSKIEMHATTLNPGEVSHPPHIHRAEEIILMRSGHVQMYINGQHYPAAGGDLVFLASGNPHALENTGAERCVYFALQWQQ
jgi:(S)-ureidoglycine aminohydrolase